jgi:hypothetical protein
LDHRGCARKGTEYKGELTGGQDDEMLVKVAQTQLKIDSPAFKELANSVLQASRTNLIIFVLNDGIAATSLISYRIVCHPIIVRYVDDACAGVYGSVKSRLVKRRVWFVSLLRRG